MLTKRHYSAARQRMILLWLSDQSTQKQHFKIDNNHNNNNKNVEQGEIKNLFASLLS